MEEEGVVHESLNLSKILSVPVLFVVENNLFSSHMHLSLRQPEISACRFAKLIIFQISRLMAIILLKYMKQKKLIEKSRKNGTPCFMEAITFEHYGHVDWRKDIDVGVNRSTKDLENWIKRDQLND